MDKLKSFFFGVVLHPYMIVFYALILGAFGIFDNEKFAGGEGAVPVYFHGMWSIYLGIFFWVAGLAYLAYCIWKNNQKS